MNGADGRHFRRRFDATYEMAGSDNKLDGERAMHAYFILCFSRYLFTSRNDTQARALRQNA